MIRVDDETAQEIVKVSIRAMALFDELIAKLQVRLPPEEYKIQKHAIAVVMGEISQELLSPIFKNYPAVEPIDRETWISAGQLHQPNWLDD